MVWNLTVLGEAAAKISSETSCRFPDIPWRSPTSLRDRIVYGYWSVDNDLIRESVADDLPGLIEQLQVVRGILTEPRVRTDGQLGC
jgi:uncharacterized protein with HEPN domain